MHRHTHSEPLWLSFSTLLKPSKDYEGHGALIPQSCSSAGTCSAAATPKEPEALSVLVFLRTPLLQLQTGLMRNSLHQMCSRGAH